MLLIPRLGSKYLAKDMCLEKPHSSYSGVLCAAHLLDTEFEITSKETPSETQEWYAVMNESQLWSQLRLDPGSATYCINLNLLFNRPLLP